MAVSLSAFGLAITHTARSSSLTRLSSREGRFARGWRTTSSPLHPDREEKIARAALAARGAPRSALAHHRHLEPEVRLARAAASAGELPHSSLAHHHHLQPYVKARSRGSGGARAASLAVRIPPPPRPRGEARSRGFGCARGGSSTAADLYLAVTHATHFSYLQSRHRPGTAGNGPSPLRSRPLRRRTSIQMRRRGVSKIFSRNTASF